MEMQEKSVNTPVSETVETVSRPDYEREIAGVIKGNYSPRAIQEKLADYHGNDIAQVMEELTPQERKKMYRVCAAEMLAEAFEYLDEETAGIYLDEMDVTKAAAVVSQLETDTAANVLHVIEKDKRALIIDVLNPDI